MQVPGAVRVAQVILWIESILSIIVGLFVLAIGLLVSAWSTTTADQANAKGVVSVAFIVFGILLIGIGGLIIWPTVLLGRLSSGARLAITVLTGVSILLDLISVPHSAGLSLIGLFLGAVVLYCLWFNPEAKAAFERASPPTGIYPGSSPIDGNM